MIEDMTRISYELQARYRKFGTAQIKTVYGKGWEDILDGEGNVIGRKRFGQFTITICPNGQEVDSAFLQGKDGFSTDIPRTFWRGAPSLPPTAKDTDYIELFEAGWDEAKRENDVIVSDPAFREGEVAFMERKARIPPYVPLMEDAESKVISWLAGWDFQKEKEN